MKKSLIYGVVLTVLLAVPALLGFAAGSFAGGQRFLAYIEHTEQAQTLAGVLQHTPLSEAQRSGYERAYAEEAGRTFPALAKEISWSVPNVPTPFVGAAPAPGTHANAHINSLQMRSEREPAMPKPAGVFRIFLTGGSTAFGSGAPSQASTIGAQLEALLQERAGGQGVRYEVFTFANPAWNSTHERIAIENYLSELAPDLIVSLSGNNDVFWGHAGRNVLWQQIFADEYFYRLLSVALQASGREPLPVLAAVIPVDPQPVAAATVAARLGKNVRLAAHALALDGTPWVFFLQPTLALTDKPLTAREQAFLNDNAFSDPEYYRAGYAAIRAELQPLALANFRFVNLTAVFDGRSDDIFLDSFHFGDKGNALIAAAMTDALFAQGVLPPPARSAVP